MRGRREDLFSNHHLPEKRTQAAKHTAGSITMKSTVVVTAAGAILMVAANITSAQETQQRAQPSARATMQDNANASAQASTDMSYGGIEATRSAAGDRRSNTCATGARCDLFSKH